MKVLAIVMFVFSALLAPVYAEDRPADTMQIVKEKIKADKKLFVAENLQLTESEAKAFWPVYESYQRDLDAINERLIKLIKEYARNFDSMTDEAAAKLVSDAVNIDVDRTKQMQTYLPQIMKALPAKKAARYYQLETKIRALINFELAAEIPLIK